MASRADPLADAKRQRECWVVSDAPIFVEKSLRLEFLRVWVCLWVMQDRPKTSQMRIQMDRQPMYHAFAITIDPFRRTTSQNKMNNQVETVPFGMKRPL